MTKRFCTFLLALVMVLCTASVTAEETAAGAVEEALVEAVAEDVAEAVVEEAVEAAEASVPVPDTLLVTLNGMEIRENNEMLQFWKQYLLDSSGVDPEEYKDLIQQYAMDYTIHYLLIEQKLAEMGKTVTDEDIKARLEAEWEAYVQEMIRDFGLDEGTTEEDKAAAREIALMYIEMYTGYTEDNFMKDLSVGKILLLSDLLEELVADNVAVQDEEVLAYYNDLVEEDKQMVADSASMYEYYPYIMGRNAYYMPEGYRGVTHILLDTDAELVSAWQNLLAQFEEQNGGDTEDGEPTGDTETDADAEPVTQEMIDAAKQAILDSVQDKIDEIKAKFEAGTSFDDLIAEYGTDPGMQDEATRAEGYAVHADSITLDPDFIAGAMKMEKVGDISEPVISSRGVHILYYLRDIPGGPVELTEEMKEEFRNALKEEKLTVALDELTSPWVEEAEIVWTEEGQGWKIPDQEAAD